MSANDVVVFMLRVTNAYGLTRRARRRDVHVDLGLLLPGPGLPPITSIRVVRPTVVDYTKVRRLDRLAGDIEAGLPIEEATAALERIRTAPPPYPRLVSMIGNAGVAPAASLLFTTSWKILLITFLTGCLVDLLLAAFDRRRVPPFFQQFAAAGFITLVAAGITLRRRPRRSRSSSASTRPCVVVGGIVMLVAGMMIVGAVQDAIDQFYVTASARVFEVFMRTAGIVAGIVIALRLAQQLGAPLSISADPIALGPIDDPVRRRGADRGAVRALGVRRRGDDPARGGHGAGRLARFHLGPPGRRRAVLADTAGALLAAVLTTLIVRRTHVPGFGLITAALLPLVPGLALYHGLLQLVGTTPGRPTRGRRRDPAARARRRGRHRRRGEPRDLPRPADQRSAEPHHPPQPSALASHRQPHRLRPRAGRSTCAAHGRAGGVCPASVGRPWHEPQTGPGAGAGTRL